MPVLFDEIRRAGIDAVAFPDDGAAKRFGHMFSSLNLEVIICGKVRYVFVGGWIDGRGVWLSTGGGGGGGGGRVCPPTSIKSARGARPRPSIYLQPAPQKSHHTNKTINKPPTKCFVSGAGRGQARHHGAGREPRGAQDHHRRRPRPGIYNIYIICIGALHGLIVVVCAVGVGVCLCMRPRACVRR